MQRATYIVFVAVPMLCALASLTYSSRPPRNSNPITVPFELIDNRIFIPVKLNGHGPFHCILDTGADALISRETAKALAVKVAEAGETSGVGERTVDSGTTRIERLEIGSLSINNFTANVADTSDEQNVFGTVPLDAAIGLPVFKRYVVKIDYLRREVTFLPFRGFEYHGTGTTIPFERPLQIPVVKAELDGVPAQFGVDTGARSSLLLYTPFVEKNSLRTKYHAKAEGITGWGMGGPVRSQLARAKQLKLGNVEVKDPIIRLSLQKAGLSTSSHLDGLMGPDVLKQFTSYFNYSRGEMILEKNTNYGQHDSYDKLGAWLGQEGAHFVVLDVIAGGAAADAGLQTGDQIMEVDGRDTTYSSLPEVRERFKTAANGTAILLKVLRGGKQQAIVVTLRELV